MQLQTTGSVKAPGIGDIVPREGHARSPWAAGPGQVTMTGADAALIHRVSDPGSAQWPDGAGGDVPFRRSGRSAGRPAYGRQSGFALGAVL